MSLLIGFLTFILVLNCLFLMLLVLIQLPKKEAGAGVAFGGGATDALFGAGTGNALTHLTKYAAIFFMGLALILAYLNARQSSMASGGLDEELRGLSMPSTPVMTPGATNSTEGVVPVPAEDDGANQAPQDSGETVPPLTTEPQTTEPNPEP